jgi:hypothetical protein
MSAHSEADAAAGHMLVRCPKPGCGPKPAEFSGFPQLLNAYCSSPTSSRETAGSVAKQQ